MIKQGRLLHWSPENSRSRGTCSQIPHRVQVRTGTTSAPSPSLTLSDWRCTVTGCVECQENQHHSTDTVARGHLRFNSLLPSSLVTPFSPLWGSSRRPFSNPTHSHKHTRTHTHAPGCSPCCLWQPHVGFRFMPCQIARIPVSHSLRHYLRKGQQLLSSRASLNFSAWLGARWLRCHGARTKNCMKPCGGHHSSRSEQHFVSFCHFATSLSKSGIPSFSTAPRCSLCCFFFFPFYGIPDVSFCHSSFVSSPPTSWPLSDSCKPQPARENVRAPCRRGCQPDKALHIIKANNCFQGPSRSRRLWMGSWVGLLHENGV